MTVYGKWPFYRFGPIQEPLSMIFSLGNLYIHLKGLSQVRRRVRKENKLRRWLEALAMIQVNTWFWSAVFHSRGESSSFSSTAVGRRGMRRDGEEGGGRREASDTRKPMERTRLCEVVESWKYWPAKEANWRNRYTSRRM